MNEIKRISYVPSAPPIEYDRASGQLTLRFSPAGHLPAGVSAAAAAVAEGARDELRAALAECLPGQRVPSVDATGGSYDFSEQQAAHRNNQVAGWDRVAITKLIATEFCRRAAGEDERALLAEAATAFQDLLRRLAALRWTDTVLGRLQSGDKYTGEEILAAHEHGERVEAMRLKGL